MTIAATTSQLPLRTGRAYQPRACADPKSPARPAAHLAPPENERNRAHARSTRAAMIVENLCMWWRVALVGVVMAAGCTKPNPRSCNDGICNDPAFPFCDVDGALGGEPKECIAVSCEPMQFESCRGDRELRCNANGNNYESTQCELGCSAATDGCRLCEPNQTTCTNGKVATCDANGAVVATEECALGCFENEPRCRQLDPSNGLAQYLDFVESPPDLDLKNASFNTSTGMVRTATGATIAVPSFSAPNPGGPSLRVFVANNVRLENVAAFSDSTDPFTGPAFALVARGEIVVEGRLGAGSLAGGIKDEACSGGVGDYFETESSFRAVASGGGGNATPGAPGGAIGGLAGGKGGDTFGNEVLVPLRGGCPGGGVGAVRHAEGGGGAIQLSSEKGIIIGGIIDVRGETGFTEQAGNLGAAIYGGGAGGGILLEAPTVTLRDEARLIAKGGGGGSYGPSHAPDDTANPDPGNVCPGACPDGGDGAAPGSPAEPGEPSPVTTGYDLISGGGGGGLGRVRINTKDATYTKSSSTIEAAVVSTGLLRTR